MEFFNERLEHIDCQYLEGYGFGVWILAMGATVGVNLFQPYFVTWIIVWLLGRGPIKAHSYRRACFPYFPKFGSHWRYVSIFGGVLSLFVKLSRSKKIKFVKFRTFGKKIQENMEGWNIARKIYWLSASWGILFWSLDTGSWCCRGFLVPTLFRDVDYLLITGQMPYLYLRRRCVNCREGAEVKASIV